MPENEQYNSNNKHNPMKIFLFAAITALLTSCCAGGNCSKPASSDTGAVNTGTLSEHNCTAACADGQHIYAHGEKGHVCDASCTAGEATAEPALVEHACTANCKAGQHMYAHGEVGHACDHTCQHARMKRDM